MDVAKPLEYQNAHDHPRFFQRNRRRIAIIAVIAATLPWIRPAYQSIQLSYWMHRCMTYNAPPNQVVFAFDADHQQSDIFQINPDESRLETFGSGGSLQMPAIFLHEIHRPDGSSRLVALNISGSSIDGPTGQPVPPQFYAQVWTPRLFHAAFRPSPFFSITLNLPNTIRQFKAYTGQIDPADPSHFTFNYEVNGQPFTADAWLKNDDTLLVSPRP